MRLSQVREPAVASDLDVLEIDEALRKLATEHPEKAELVKLRYFGGLTISQAADVLSVSTTTADKYWAFARSWIRLELQK